ncbi:MAG: NusG domain II-containing protein [Clostridiales bacterium]|nr:NusG domain II-containing protein [Clostridiales bacterium]
MNVEAVKKIKRSKPFTLLDVVLVVIIAVIIGLSAWLSYRAPVATVRITADGYEKTLSITDKADIELDCLTVHIDGGYVWVTDADCADKVCEHTGRISRAGQSIVCLPNGVVVTIVGGNKGDDLDWEVG